MAHIGCLSLFASTLLLLLLLMISCFFFYDVEASSCPSVLHKFVGDTVEFPSCLPPEGVNDAYWKYKDKIVVVLGGSPVVDGRFEDRASLNPTNLSLTVRRLTLQDSGDYSFLSEVNNVQRRTVTITLQVHAPLTPPILTVASTWSAASESCAVLLDCNSTSDGNVTHRWTVKNQTFSGSRLQYTIWPQEETTVTCTILNLVGGQSASVAVKCDDSANTTGESPASLLMVPLMSGLIIGSLLIILLLLPLVFCSQSKGGCRNRGNQSQPVNQDETQQHVYSSLLYGDGAIYGMLGVSGNAALRLE